MNVKNSLHFGGYHVKPGVKKKVNPPLFYHKEDDREIGLQLGSSDQAEDDTTVITATITKYNRLFEYIGKYLSKSHLKDYPEILNISMHVR